MGQEEWKVTARLFGEFYITDEVIDSNIPISEELTRFTITPEVDKSGKFTGFNIASRASLIIGRPVLFSDGISIKQLLSEETAQYRIILSSGQSADIVPPAHLPAKLLTVSISPKIQRVIRWFTHGLASNDTIDKMVSFNNALDILACMVDSVPNRIRKCTKCGSEEVIGPGLRERVLFYLTKILSLDEKEAIDIYESRLDLAHGRSNLSEEEIRHYREQSNTLSHAIRYGIAKELVITLPIIPDPNPFDLSSALLDLIYHETKPPDNNNP
jgi:hypothetical protein